MQIGVSLAAFLCCMVVFFPSPAWGVEQAGQKASSELSLGAPSGPRSALSGMEAALHALQNARYDEAFHLYMDMVRQQPDLAEASYGLALAAQGSGRYSHALLALERLTDSSPSNASLRVQLARVHLKLNDSESARREWQAALRLDALLAARQGEDVRRALTVPKKAPSLWHWNGWLGAGFMHDSNVNQGPPSPFMRLGDWPLYVHDVAKQASWGRYISTGLGLDRRFHAQSPWSMVADASFYKRWNQSDKLKSHYEFAWGRSALGLRYLGKRVLLEGRVRLEAGDEGQDQHTFLWGVETSALWAVHRQVHLISRAAWEKRFHYLDKSKNGEYWWLGQYVRLFFGEQRHEIMLGVRHIQSLPVRESLRSAGWDASARLTLRLTPNFSVSPFVEGSKTWYEGPGVFLELKHRADAAVRWGVSVRYRFRPGLYGEVGWRSSRNWSHSPLYRYTQQATTVGLTWMF